MKGLHFPLWQIKKLLQKETIKEELGVLLVLYSFRALYYVAFHYVVCPQSGRLGTGQN